MRYFEMLGWLGLRYFAAPALRPIVPGLRKASAPATQFKVAHHLPACRDGFPPDAPPVNIPHMDYILPIETHNAIVEAAYRKRGFTAE